MLLDLLEGISFELGSRCDPHYPVAQEMGHRVSMSVTIEASKADRLGQADRALVESLELFVPAPQTAAATEAADPSTTVK